MTPPSERPFSQTECRAARAVVHTFRADEQPWPEVKRWPIGRPLLSARCLLLRHAQCARQLRRGPSGRMSEAEPLCQCGCHVAGAEFPVASGRKRTIVLTDRGRRDLAEMRGETAS